MPTITRHQALVERAAERGRVSCPRALVWDGKNTASVIVAETLRARGWIVDWIGSAASPWSNCSAVDGERTLLDGPCNEDLERVLWEHPLDALFVCGDDQVRWLLGHWAKLPATIRRHLPAADALVTALSKERSMQLAERLGLPVLPTERCSSPTAVAAASRRLGSDAGVVVKGEGGSAGSTVRALGTGKIPPPALWRAVTHGSPVVLVQRRLGGPRLIVTVAYERGVERAACGHEKVAAWPYLFGQSAFGVTRRVEVVHAYTQRIFAALDWHGMADIEFRQDLRDGKWYFMEINPRVTSSLGIQALAGVDTIATWAAICAGRGAEESPGRRYRDGVRYCWTVPALALALRRPWNLPWWAARTVRAETSDLGLLDPSLQARAMRLSLWLARHS